MPETLAPSPPSATEQAPSFADLAASFLDDSTGTVSPETAPTPEVGQAPTAGVFDLASENDQPANPAPENSQPATQPAAEPDPLAPHIEALINARIPDIPPFLVGASKAQLDNWQALKGVVGKLTHENASLQLLSAQRDAQPVPSNGDGSTAMPESEAITRLQMQLKALEGDANQWREQQARQQIGETPGFRREFDAPRAAILRELTAAAKKSGVADPGEAAEEFLRADSEFGQSEWIEERFDGEDSAAAKFFAKKGREFLELSARAEEAMTAPDPISRLRDWNDYEAAFSTKMAATMGQAVQQQFQAAFPRVRQELLSDDSGDPQFFSTPAGADLLSGIGARLAEGRGISPEEIIRGLADGARAETYRNIAEKFGKRIQDLQASLAKAGAVEPASAVLTQPGAPAPTAGSDNDGMPFMGIERAEPLVTLEELSRAGL